MPKFTIRAVPTPNPNPLFEVKYDEPTNPKGSVPEVGGERRDILRNAEPSVGVRNRGNNA